MSKIRNSQTGILQPFSMETKVEYYARVERNALMRELFPNLKERMMLARKAFAAKWAGAQVTVTKVDGTQFFIE